MNRRHGGAGRRDPEYLAWCHIIARCHNPKTHNYHNYGGRGILVCEAWRYSYEAFLSHVGRRPTRKHSIDRIDVNGHYEPGNVRWATKKQQGSNMRKNHILEYGGEKLTIAEWADRLGFNYDTLFARIVKRKWPIEQAFRLIPRRGKRRPG